MKKNMGSLDRTIRSLLAIGFLVLYFTGAIAGTLAIVLLILGIVLLLTLFVSYCPLYRVLGLTTLPKSKETVAHI